MTDTPTPTLSRPALKKQVVLSFSEDQLDIIHSALSGYASQQQSYADLLLSADCSANAFEQNISKVTLLKRALYVAWSQSFLSDDAVVVSIDE